MKILYKFLPLVLMLLICSSSAYSADAPWKKIGESKGIIGYTRPTPLSSVEQIKATGTIDEPIAVVEAVVRDVPAQVIYMYLCKESEFIDLPGKQNSVDIYYLYNLTDMPGFISDRDCIARSEWKIDKETGIIYSHSEGVKSDYKLKKGNVCMPLVINDYMLVPKGPDKTEITYEALADPGGSLPSWLVNLLTKDICIKTVAGIRKLSATAKYKNAKIITTTPK